MTSVKTDPRAQSGGPRSENAQDYDLSAVAMPRAPEGNPFARTPALKDLPVLEKGDRGDMVKLLQAKLRQEGYSIAIDGVFGPGTERAVEAFQIKEGLKPDGDVGPKTWSKLVDDDYAAASAAPSPERPVTPSGGASREAATQTSYNDWRDDALTVSGNDPRFQAMMSFVRRWEGGYTVDHAGPTNYGITKPFYQEYLKDNGKSSLFSKSVRSLTEKDAIGIYHDQIWKRGGVEDVATASDRAGIARGTLSHKNSTALLGVALGNGSVNYGEGRAERFLKEAFDGAGIPAGELADRAVIAARQGKVDKVLARYLESEEAHYKRLGKEAKYDQYLEGWMNRHNSLEGALRGPLREGVPVALLQKDVK